MLNFKVIWLAGVMLTLLGCDCVRRTSGIVIDGRTGLPIADATIKNSRAYKPASIRHSDSSGTFEYSDISGGFRCPPLHLAIMASGYVTQEMRATRCCSLDTIRMVRSD